MNTTRSDATSKWTAALEVSYYYSRSELVNQMPTIQMTAQLAVGDSQSNKEESSDLP